MTDSKQQSGGFLPPRWVVKLAWRAHRGLYRVTGNRLGLSRPKADNYGVANLKTTGRKSGLERSVMIGYFEDGDDLVTMAMNGWGPAEPAWWLNLQANPKATAVLSGQTVVEVVGHAATGAERDRLWERWREIDKKLDGWAARRPTETAVVILTPTAEPDLR